MADAQLQVLMMEPCACGIVEGKTAQRSMKTHRDPISALALSKDGRLVASGSSDGTVLVWDLEGYRRSRNLAHQGSLAFAVEFSADGSRVAAGFTEGSVRVWDLETDPESSVLEKRPQSLFFHLASALTAGILLSALPAT